MMTRNGPDSIRKCKEKCLDSRRHSIERVNAFQSIPTDALDVPFIQTLINDADTNVANHAIKRACDIASESMINVLIATVNAYSDDRMLLAMRSLAKTGNNWVIEEINRRLNDGSLSIKHAIGVLSHSKDSYSAELLRAIAINHINDAKIVLQAGRALIRVGCFDFADFVADRFDNHWPPEQASIAFACDLSIAKRVIGVRYLRKCLDAVGSLEQPVVNALHVVVFRLMRGDWLNPNWIEDAKSWCDAMLAENRERK